MCLSKWYCSSLILLLPEGFITNIYSPKCSALEAGEIDPWLRALVALAEDLGLVPAFAWWFTTICNSSAKGPVPSSDLLKCQVHMVHIHTCRQNTRTHKTKISASLKKTFTGTFTNSLKSISTFLELMFLIESAIAVLKNVLISQLYEKTCNLLNAEIVCSLPTPCLYWLYIYFGNECTGHPHSSLLQSQKHSAPSKFVFSSLSKDSERKWTNARSKREMLLAQETNSSITKGQNQKTQFQSHQNF